MTLTTGTTGNDGPGKTKSWTTRRWIHAVIVTLALQLAVIIVASRHVVVPGPRPTFPTRVRLAADPPSDSLKDLMTVTDPALFALPSLHGFSGAAWLRYPLLQPTAFERTEVPQWLGLNPARLANEFVEFVSTNQISPVLMVDAPLPAATRYEANYPSEAVAPLSRFHLAGGLARRTLLYVPHLPPWPHSEILSNTIVRAVVDAAGWNFSATLVGRSGLPAADEYATRLVENARFTPLKAEDAQKEEFTWGTFVFYWHTQPLPVTNAPANLP